MRAAEAVPAYFARYERAFDLPVHRPVRVRSVARTGTHPGGHRTDPGHEPGTGDHAGRG